MKLLKLKIKEKKINTKKETDLSIHNYYRKKLYLFVCIYTFINITEGIMRIFAET